MAAAEGVTATAFAPFALEIGKIMPPIIEGIATDIDARTYPGEQANLAMMAAGVEHVLHAGRAKGIDMTGLEAVKASADRALAEGRGAEGFTSIFEVMRTGR
ncbi:hypothetical protein [Streptomyces sp. XD-27]|uniref:imine reductase family protein n=1 Tax=Streptomyces sp. XD-27 TaxID=3062779 RepID=UPI00350E53D9